MRRASTPSVLSPAKYNRYNTMKRKLLKQITNEWRSNLWLAIELLLISVVLWYIMDYCGVYMGLTNEPMGVDTEHVYTLSTVWKTEESPTYVAPTDEESEWNQLQRFVNRLKENPDIECVASGSNAVYNYNFSGRFFAPEVPFDSTAWFNGRVNNFFVDPNYPKVFGIHGINGETPEQLAAILDEGKIVVTTNLAQGSLSARDLMNMVIYVNGDSTEAYTIGAVIEPIRRAKFEGAWHATALMPTNGINNIYFRVKPEADHNFVDKLMAESEASLNYGNVYVSDVSSFDSICESLHRDDNAQLRNLYICMGFLLLTVFLGILGTFWFRTQQRAKELAIRITAGATRRQLFARLIGEVLLLLLIVTPFAIGLDYLLAIEALPLSVQFYGLFDWGAYQRMIIEALITFGAMALMIVCGILFPAIRAMKIEPAVVLADE